MDDLGILARDFGIRPKGNAAPMASSKSSVPVGSGTSTATVQNWNKTRSASSWTSMPDGDLRFGSGVGGISTDRSPPPYDEVFLASSRKSSTTPVGSIFEGYSDAVAKAPSIPVYDKPVYDDDIFDGIPGMKSSSTVKYDDVFVSMSSVPEGVSSPPYDDLLENLGKGMPETKGSGEKNSRASKHNGESGFEELIPGFGGSSQPQQQKWRVPLESNHDPSIPSSSMPDPFADLGTTTPAHQSHQSYDDPLKNISGSMNSQSTNTNSFVTGFSFADFGGHGKSASSSEIIEDKNEESLYRTNQDYSSARNLSEEPSQRPSVDAFENVTSKDQLKRAFDSQRPLGRPDSQSSSSNTATYDQNSVVDQSQLSNQHAGPADDVWLTVSEIPLFTKPTSAPPPSRSPPPITRKKSPVARTDDPVSPILRGRKKDVSCFTLPNQSYSSYRGPVKEFNASSIDELEDFAMGRPHRYPNESAEFSSAELDIDANLRDAMGRAEEKFRQAKEVREKERDVKSGSSKDYVRHERVDRPTTESQNWQDREKQEQVESERLQREEKEQEQRRLDMEREQELEKERERARKAVERATREARERAAAEARQKAEKAASEKARQQAERLAFQRAAAEARERAANEARERAEKAKEDAKAKAAAEREKVAAEAREKAAAERAAAEARQRAAERAAVERAAIEARNRAATEAKEKAAAAAREKQNKTDNDLEAFFSMGSRASSAPKQRSPTSGNAFDVQSQSKGGTETMRSSSSGSNLNVKRVSTATNIVDDLSSIFGASQSSGGFQEVEGESEDRRRARLERHQRTVERAAKALAEKNERDMQLQREQEEIHKMDETLDFEIKRWAAGKEGNLRALLSTLQYVLWPDCGWQPVSLTELITAAAVKRFIGKQLYVFILIKCNKRVQLFNRSTLRERCLTSSRKLGTNSTQRSSSSCSSNRRAVGFPLCEPSISVISSPPVS
ncbi:hypothetical protein HPP92_010677 [Vanilla planifolia]|uniref:Auxilin-related protein 2 n=1 Tax=Vanilla planifolia TaxID=51239 RepID=A0A835R0I9_VANPL|nr:hypothetical protein HPP92_010677 [Vanilla planifolia]